jgi:hypothetical protein
MDAASSWTHSASTPRSSIYAGPGTTPPRHRPDSTNPPSVHHSTDNPQPVSAQSPTQGRQTTKQSVQPAYGETVTPARVQCGPRAICEKRTRPMAPPAYGRP